jgi:hypothetical protein
MTTDRKKLSSFNKRIEGMTMDDIAKCVYKKQYSPMFQTSLSLLEVLKHVNAANTKQIILHETFKQVEPLSKYVIKSKEAFIYIINLLEYFTIESTEEFNLEEIEFIKKKLFFVMDTLSLLMVQINHNQLITSECGLIYNDLRTAVNQLLFIRSKIRIETSIENFHKELIDVQQALQDMSALNTKSAAYKEATNSNMSCQYFAKHLKYHIEEILEYIYHYNKHNLTNDNSE